MNDDPKLVHGSCVSLGGKGALLMGASGSGKSDLALRLIDHSAVLVSDDQVEITRVGKILMASPPSKIAGLFEVRGVGIFQVGYVSQVPLALAVKLVPQTAVERLPEPAFFDCLGVKLPLLSLHAFDDSTPAKIRLFLQSA